MSKRTLQIAILWTSLSGYFNACLYSLWHRHNVDLLVFHIVPPDETSAPFEIDLFSWMPQRIALPDGARVHRETILERLRSFSPDAVLVSGWSVPAYREVTKDIKAEGVYVISGVDNPWRNTPRQRLGVLLSKWYLHNRINTLWVPGDRAARFAQYLGYTDDNLMFGVYSADQPLFQEVADWRFADNDSISKWPPRFVFIGRLNEVKGVRELVEAYALYRDSVENPWELWCAGSGPLESMLENKPGIKALGFVQPSELGEVFKEASVFVLPSRHEPWGVVIHEAAAAGLPIICTYQCGSSPELVQDGQNGFLFDAGNVNALAERMAFISSGSVDIAKFGRRSAELSSRYSPNQWADYLVQHLERVLQKK